METTESGLKHLGFVRVLAAQTVVVLSFFYDYAKRNSGPLKSTVGTVENAVKAAVGPVYERVKGLPDETLSFVDKKVDELAPPLAKKALTGADQVVQKAIEAGQVLLQEAKLGPHSVLVFISSSISNFAAGMLPVLGSTVDHYPVLRVARDASLPTISCWSEEYNDFVTKMAARGYPIFGYLPKVPIEYITKSFKQDGLAPAEKGVGVVPGETN